jgi:hypothetical protein
VLARSDDLLPPISKSAAGESGARNLCPLSDRSRSASVVVKLGSVRTVPRLSLEVHSVSPVSVPLAFCRHCPPLLSGVDASSRTSRLFNYIISEMLNLHVPGVAEPYSPSRVSVLYAFFQHA